VCAILGEVFRWLGMILVVLGDLFILLESFCLGASNKNMRKGFLLIWHSVLWVVWKVRNDLIFRAKNHSFEEIIYDVKHLSWSWFMGRKSCASCIFFEWYSNPRFVSVDRMGPFWFV